jgi:hypothetical protein
VAACNGSASQTFNISADAQTGDFILKAASTGRCMQVHAGATTAGSPLESDDCVAGSVIQKFAIQAAGTTTR